MKSAEDLKKTIRRVDGRGYKAYKDIQGIYEFSEYTLYIEHVQGDPFASPSKIRIRVPSKISSFPQSAYKNKSREIALRDFITRRFYDVCKKFCKGRRGTGKSGIIEIDKPGQEILERTSAFVNDDFVEVRFVMGLPAFGRAISGRHAEEMFFTELPKIVENSLIFKNLNEKKLYEHIEVSEDADYIRHNLMSEGLVAFVADGAILPRLSGIDQRPMPRDRVVPFKSPESLRVEVETPNHGNMTGMGIEKGVTLIVGGGYHGKSTLLKAIEMGIYNHIPGDGREFVISAPETVKIRSEDGRRIEKVDISPFITNLPFGRETNEFSTDDASGSTSQAANIIEYLEVGAKVLLIDEDTSATNFMIRDHRMQELVSKDKEPITPFIDKVRDLYSEYEVSTILVIGGSGDYFDVADRVICMVEYLPYDVTEKAKSIARKFKTNRKKEGAECFGRIRKRIPLSQSFDPSKGKRDVKISSKGLHSIVFGKHSIDLGAVEQLVDISQTRAIGDAIYYATKYMDGKRTMNDVIDAVMKDIERKSLDILHTHPRGDYAYFRGLELAASINRLRTLKVRQSP